MTYNKNRALTLYCQLHIASEPCCLNHANALQACASLMTSSIGAEQGKGAQINLKRL